MLDQSRLLIFSSRLYTLLLLAYPTRFRRAYGQEMAQVFRDDIRCTFQEGGATGLMGLWFLVMLDLLKTACAEHISEVFHMPMNKLLPWSGPAAAVGGVLWATVWLLVVVLEAGIDNSLLLLVLPSGLLMAVGLTGLYRCLPASLGPANGLVFAAALLGTLLLTAGSIGLFLVDYAIASAAMVAGFYATLAGIAGMALITIFKRALGPWSSVPLFLTASLLGFLLTMSDAMGGSVDLIFTVLYGVGWLLLGVALWARASTNDVPGPALPA